MNLSDYQIGDFFDEMFTDDGQPRPAVRPLVRKIESLSNGELASRQSAADRALVQAGITFNVYGEGAGLEKILPFDLAPRMVTAAEWERIERGLKQRIRALNLFIDDLYHDQKIIFPRKAKKGASPRSSRRCLRILTSLSIPFWSTAWPN